MSDKNLTELEWKKFAKGRNLKDAALVKALADLERAAKTGPDAQLSALADIEKQADGLRKSAKGDKELAGYLDDLDKALDKQRKLSDLEAKKAAKAVSEDEEEETPALLTTKMVPLLRQVKKGEEMPVLLASTGKEVAVMLSRRAISPSKRKLLTTYLDGGTPKFFAGTCIFEENTYTFVLKTQAGGLAKKVKAALLKQVELRLRVRVRGEDPNDVDEELGDADDADEAAGASTASGPGAGADAGAAPDGGADQRALYEQTKKSLYPRISAAVREGVPNKDRIVTLMGLAQKTEGTQGWAAGIALYEQLAALLPAAPAAAPAPTAPAAPKADTEDLQARYEARSAQLTPLALAALKAQQGDVSKIRAVAEFAREKGDSGNYKAALAGLDSLEKLLPAAAAQAAPPATADGTAAFNARLAALLPKVKQAQAAAGADEIKLKVRDAGVLAAKKEFERANTLLDEVEAQLPKTAGGKNEGQDGGAKAASQVAFAQSRLAWDRTRKFVQTELRKLESAILAQCAEESDFEEIRTGSAQLYEVLEVLDERLMDKLDDAYNAQGDKRKALHGEAREIIAEYLEFVNSEPLMQDIDQSGFVDLKILPTLNAQLQRMDKELGASFARY